ncbi:hypothetical protein AYO44_09500 [Planctomycetaceae bacterium SCGC AG-212-F19]|nr:hypothetical protein AYO44_09500 [Planctomycetaceae bacterium SCGC AG-212-F19]
MSRNWRTVLLTAVILAGVYVAMILLRVHPLVEVADTADQLHMNWIAESIYEYRAIKGHWPSRPDDLLQTSLAVKAPHDIGLLKTGPYVVVWPQDLDPDPKKNGGRVLVYTRGGPARLGWVWVCWGDYRMEYMKGEQFEAILQANQ